MDDMNGIYSAAKTMVNKPPNINAPLSPLTINPTAEDKIIIPTLYTALILILLLLSVTAEAARLHPERYYQEEWCEANNGKLEHVLQDMTRVDCLTVTHAVEVDFSDKFYQAIGQAIFYSEMTGLLPGVLLIMENPQEDYRYLVRLLTAVQNIDDFRVWIIK